MVVSTQRGCCFRSPLATKLLHMVLFHDDFTQPDVKKMTSVLENYYLFVLKGAVAFCYFGYKTFAHRLIP